MTERFEILDHTADIGFRAFGASMAELFVNAALALESIAMETAAIQPRFEYPVAAHGEDWESLLVNWLNEIVYYLDGERVAISRFEISELTPTQVRAKSWGEPRDAHRHPASIVVKAATYHQLKIEEQGGRWTACVFLDI